MDQKIQQSVSEANHAWDNQASEQLESELKHNPAFLHL